MRYKMFTKMSSSCRLDKEVIAQKKASDELKGVRKRLSDKESQLVALNDEVKHVEGMVVELKKECQDLRDSLESAKYALEQETLTRVDLENKLQSKEEELNFKKEMYHKVNIKINYCISVHAICLRGTLFV